MNRFLSACIVLACLAAPVLADDYSLINAPGHLTASGGTSASFNPTDMFSVYRFETNLMNNETQLAATFDVMIYNQLTPITATNFEGYADAGAFTSSLYHRNIPGSVLQGGSFYMGDPNPDVHPTMPYPWDIATGDPIPMEWVGLSNVAGTIAMARTSDLNSATSGWFFNTGDNSGPYDAGGAYGPYAVFGEVLYDGMDLVGFINSLGSYNVAMAWGWPGACQETPLLLDGQGGALPLWNETVTEVTGLTYEVVEHTLGNDVTVSIVDGELVLDNVGTADARGEVTVRGLDAGGNTFLATINITPTGDFDFDGNINDTDLDLLGAAIVAGSTDAQFDLNGDGNVNAMDFELLVTGLVDTTTGLGTGTVYGDCNLDTVIDLLDLGLLGDGYIAGASRWAEGDTNGDGVINLLDLGLLGDSYVAASAEIPEPTTMTLLGLGGLAMLKRRRR